MILKVSQASDSVNQSFGEKDDFSDRNPTANIKEEDKLQKTQRTNKQQVGDKRREEELCKTTGKPGGVRDNDPSQSNQSYEANSPIDQSSGSEFSNTNYEEMSKGQLKGKLIQLRTQKTEIAKKFKDLIHASKQEREELLHRLERISDLSHAFCTKLGETAVKPNQPHNSIFLSYDN